MTVINIKDYIRVDDVAEFTLAISDGKPILCLTWASDEFVDEHDSISERFIKLKEMILEGALFLDECAKDFETKEKEDE